MMSGGNGEDSAPVLPPLSSLQGQRRSERPTSQGPFYDTAYDEQHGEQDGESTGRRRAASSGEAAAEGQNGGDVEMADASGGGFTAVNR